MLKVIKRDGRKVKFSSKKIEMAVQESFRDIDGEVSHYAVQKSKEIAQKAEENFKDKKEIRVEEIQDFVEECLMATKRKDVAKNYILYRDERSRIRQKNSELLKVIREKLSATNVQNQNANVDEYSFGGRRGEADSELNKYIALNEIMSKKARDNHINNRIYTHDLDSYVVGCHNCLSIPFDDLLANGFNTRQTDVRPAGSINTAFQLIAVIFQLQSLQQFGGVSATHLDWTMVPYVRKSFAKHYRDGLIYVDKTNENKINNEINHMLKNAKDYSIESKIYQTCSQNVYEYAIDMTKRELNQAVEGMFHNLNTLQSRSGNQLPFTSINYGTCTLTEGRMVTKALLEKSIEGVGKIHKTPIFPCSIFQCMNGVNRKPGDPNYDLFQLALKSTSLRLYPNYANVDWSGNAGYDVNDPKTYFSTMGCRTANGYDVNADQGVNPQTKDGRGNICPVTIILPTLAMEANGDVNNFMEVLANAIDDAKDQLIERYKWICLQSPESAKFMYENNVMLGYKPEEGIRSALKHGTLAIGQLGMAEALQILVGCDQTMSTGLELAKKIERLFKGKCAEFKKKYKLNFGVYFSPEHSVGALTAM